MNYQELKAARETAIKAMLIAEISWDKIKEAMSCGYDTINRVSRTLEAPRPKVLPTRKIKLTQERIPDVIEMLKQNENGADVARHFGISRHMITRLRKQYAINL